MSEEGSGRRRWSRGGTARTRAVLLAAAAEVFAERGYDGASVDEIARAAGVSVGSIYSRFGNKKALFRALMADVLDNDLTQAREGLAGGIAEALAAMDARLAEVAGSRRDTLLEAETWASAMRTPDLHAALAEHDAATRDAAARLIAGERERTGQSWAMSDDEIATALLALYHGLIRRRRLDPDSVAPDLYGRLVLVLARGLASEQTNP